MRVKQPEPFDPNKEYNPGERCVYRGMVLIAEIWTAADDILATVAIDALNAYAKAKQTQERRNNPETDDCDCPV